MATARLSTAAGPAAGPGTAGPNLSRPLPAGPPAISQALANCNSDQARHQGGMCRQAPEPGPAAGAAILLVPRRAFRANTGSVHVRVTCTEPVTQVVTRQPCSESMKVYKVDTGFQAWLNITNASIWKGARCYITTSFRSELY